MPNGNEEVLEPGRNTLAAIVAGVLVVIAGFLVYNYFSRVGKQGDTGVSGEEISFEDEGLTLPKPEEIAAEEEQITNGETTEGTTNDEQEQSAEEATETESPPQTETKEEPFVINDLTPNSLSGDSYTVNRGDTLWEIAEARYGSGFEWGKILDANKDVIGFLPNGSQALIVPGQNLVLPS